MQNPFSRDIWSVAALLLCVAACKKQWGPDSPCDYIDVDGAPDHTLLDDRAGGAGLHLGLIVPVSDPAPKGYIEYVQLSPDGMRAYVEMVDYPPFSDFNSLGTPACGELAGSWQEMDCPASAVYGADGVLRRLVKDGGGVVLLGGSNQVRLPSRCTNPRALGRHGNDFLVACSDAVFELAATGATQVIELGDEKLVPASFSAFIDGVGYVLSNDARPNTSHGSVRRLRRASDGTWSVGAPRETSSGRVFSLGTERFAVNDRIYGDASTEEVSGRVIDSDGDTLLVLNSELERRQVTDDLGKRFYYTDTYTFRRLDCSRTPCSVVEELPAGKVETYDQCYWW